MDFDHECVRAGSEGGEGHLWNKFAQSDRVCWVDNYWQMGFGFQERNCAKVERVAGRRLKRTNPALAENHVHVALAQDVFGAHDQVIDCSAESALE